MKLKIQGNLSDPTTISVVDVETGERLQLVQKIEISVGAGDVVGLATITILDVVELDLAVDDPEVVTTVIADSDVIANSPEEVSAVEETERRKHVLIEAEANDGKNYLLSEIPRRDERRLATMTMSIDRLGEAHHSQIGKAIRQFAKALGAESPLVHCSKFCDKLTVEIFDTAR